MRTGYLRRFKRIFSWHYDHSIRKWILFNEKDKTVIKRDNAWEIVSYMLGRKSSLNELISYYNRKIRVEKRRVFEEEKKRISPDRNKMRRLRTKNFNTDLVVSKY